MHCGCATLEKIILSMHKLSANIYIEKLLTLIFYFSHDASEIRLLPHVPSPGFSSIFLYSCHTFDHLPYSTDKTDCIIKNYIAKIVGPIFFLTIQSW